jgi:thymidylate kinase
MPANPDRTTASAAVLQALSLPRFREPSASAPVTVAIEGPNGAGKTTLSWALSRKLGVPWCLGTDEAWFAEPLKVRMIRDAEWFASAMFFLSGCFEQTRLLRTRPDRFMIMDRCLWSTLAVHAAVHFERLEGLIAMLQPIARQIQVPSLTIVLEASFATCQSRIANKSGTARALDELTATSTFHAREREFYHWLGQQTPTPQPRMKLQTKPWTCSGPGSPDWWWFDDATCGAGFASAPSSQN